MHHRCGSPIQRILRAHGDRPRGQQVCFAWIGRAWEHTTVTISWQKQSDGGLGPSRVAITTITTRRPGEGSCQDRSAGNNRVCSFGSDGASAGRRADGTNTTDALNWSSRRAQLSSSCTRHTHHRRSSLPAAAAIAALASTSRRSSTNTIPRAPPRL